jgi:hypothetical protein
MPDPALLKAASDVGGWVTAVIIIAGLLVLLWRALTAGDVVSGVVHRRALDQLDRQGEAMARLTGSLETFSTQTAATLRELRADVDEIRGLRQRRD